MKFLKSESRLMAEKHLHLQVPADPEGTVSGLSWAALHEERSAVRKASSNLINRAKEAGRELTDEEEAAFDAGMTYIDAIQEEFDRRDVSGKKEPSGGDQPHRVNFNRSQTMNDANPFRPRRTWREIFGREPQSDPGVKTFGEALLALHHDDQEKLRTLRTMNSIQGSEGGFAIPEQTWAEIYDSGLEASVTLDKVSTYPMSTDSLHVPAWESDDHTKGPIGAVAGSWLGEGTEATRVTPQLRALSLYGHKLALYLAVTSECLMDSGALAASLSPMMRNSLAFALDEAVLTGSGISRPLGILNSPATIAVSRAASSNIAFSDLTGMMGRLLPSSLDKAIWLCSPSTFAVLLGLVVTAGTGELAMGFQPGGSDIRMQILGRPVRVTEKLPTMASTGGLALVDLSYFALALRETGRFERTNAAQWTSDIVDFRLILRCDGKPLIAKPFTPAGGGDTLSPFVILSA